LLCHYPFHSSWITTRFPYPILLTWPLDPFESSLGGSFRTSSDCESLVLQNGETLVEDQFNIMWIEAHYFFLLECSNCTSSKVNHNELILLKLQLRAIRSPSVVNLFGLNIHCTLISIPWIMMQFRKVPWCLEETTEINKDLYLLWFPFLLGAFIFQSQRKYFNNNFLLNKLMVSHIPSDHHNSKKGNKTPFSSSNSLQISIINT
jgi:hypothetical protein